MTRTGPDDDGGQTFLDEHAEERHEHADDGPTDEQERSAERTGRSRARLALLIAAGLVVLLVAGVVGFALVLQSRVSSSIEWIDDPFTGLTDRPDAVTADPAEGTASHDPVNILLLGSDSRISAGDPSQWVAGAQRTDAIMLLHVAGDRRSAQVMSIPRDSWVVVPGHGPNKINAAFSFGGPPLLIQTVEQLTGVRIDHFAVADFEAFAAVTDALGGVEINLPNGMQSRDVQLAPGTHLLTGDQALTYARQRYGLPGGDFDRVQRQQNWLRAIASRAFSRDVLSDPLQVTELITLVASSLSVDESFTVGEMRTLALSLRELRPGSVTYLTVPVSGTGWSPDGRQSIVNLDMAHLQELMAAVGADRVPEYLEENPDDVRLLGSTVS